jgi:hypothetical protein
VSYRSDAVRAAIKEWKAYPSGRPEVYARAIGGDPEADWCGYFALWALQQAGVGKGVRWIQGLGFISPLHLPSTNDPQPGDIAVVPVPFQHQALVVSFEPMTGMVTTIDGNQPGIEPRVRFFKNGNLQTYSIQPLIDEAERNASAWPWLLGGAAVLGAAAWAWLNPGPIDRALRRAGI